MRRRSQRLIVIAVVGGVLALAAGLILFGLRNAITAFYAPAELAQKAAPGEHVRIGGLVVQDSIGRDASGALTFIVTDGRAQINVRYQGEPPDLFKQGSGVVIEGVYQPGDVFVASTLLARHDERYVPREVEHALKQRGEWKGDP